MTFAIMAPRSVTVFPSYFALSSLYASCALLASPIRSIASGSQFRFIVNMAKLLSLRHLMRSLFPDFSALMVLPPDGSVTSPVTISHMVASPCL